MAIPNQPLVQIDSQPVAVDRKAVEGLVGQSRSRRRLPTRGAQVQRSLSTPWYAR